MDKTDSFMKEIANVTAEEFDQIREKNQERHKIENAKQIQVQEAVKSMLQHGKTVNILKPSQKVTFTDVQQNFGQRGFAPLQIEDDEIVLQNVLSGADENKVAQTIDSLLVDHQST